MTLQMRGSLPLLCLPVALLLIEASAWADEGRSSPLERALASSIAPMFEDEATRGLFATAGTGVSADSQWSLACELGFAWGTRNSLGPRLWHVALAPSLDLLSGSTKADIAALAGYTIRLENVMTGRSVITVGIAGGVEARFTDPSGIGPTIKARLGLWWFSLFVQTSFRYDAELERDPGVRFGREYLFLP